MQVCDKREANGATSPPFAIVILRRHTLLLCNEFSRIAANVMCIERYERYLCLIVQPECIDIDMCLIQEKNARKMGNFMHLLQRAEQN